jgi:neutral ceramidase
MDYMVYQLAHTGFHSEKALNTIYGIALAIIRAHHAIRPTAIYYGSGPVPHVSINRSPKAYQANPQFERDFYETAVDNAMHIFKFIDLCYSDAFQHDKCNDRNAREKCESPNHHEFKEDSLGASVSYQRDRGLLCLFSLHPTSLNKTNHLISGDNRGIAAGILERSLSSSAHSKNIVNYDSGFVAAFPLAPSGDVSPNTEGAFCLDSGVPCLKEPRVCPGGITMCHGRGPVFNLYFRLDIRRFLGI